MTVTATVERVETPTQTQTVNVPVRWIGGVVGILVVLAAMWAASVLEGPAVPTIAEAESSIEQALTLQGYTGQTVTCPDTLSAATTTVCAVTPGVGPAGTSVVAQLARWDHVAVQLTDGQLVWQMIP